jgi:hypothetical protein
VASAAASISLALVARRKVVGQFGVSEIDYLTEPSADRGPRRGSPAGVVDAPDAGGKRRTKQVAHHPRSFSGC